MNASFWRIENVNERIEANWSLRDGFSVLTGFLFAIV